MFNDIDAFMRAAFVIQFPGVLIVRSLFAGLQIFFLLLVSLAATELVAEFGVGRIATANLLAAGAMSVALLRPHHEAGPLFPKRVVGGVLLAVMFTALFLVFWYSSAYVAVGQ